MTIKDTIINLSKKLNLLDNNFLPRGTVIHVKQDGTGDFTNIQDAINYLTGKYSNGEIHIHIGAGTYTVSDYAISLNTLNFNFSKLRIYGDGINNTIIQRVNITNDYQCVFHITYNGTVVELSDICIKSIKSNDSYGLETSYDAVVALQDIKLEDTTIGLHASENSKVTINNVTINNCNNGLMAHSADIQFKCYSTITASNLTYVFSVYAGGTIRLSDVKKYLTNVNNISTMSIGTISANGYIIGKWNN